MSFNWQRFGVYVVCAISFVFSASCKTQEDCRPGTILLQVPCAEGVKKFQVYYTKTGQAEQQLDDILDPVCPQTNVQVSVANYAQLAGNSSVVFRVVAIDEAGVAIDMKTAKADLTGSCVAVTASVAGGDGGIGTGDDAGTPTLTCAADQHVCGTECVSNNDPLTCGSSCTSCQAPVNGTATCDGTKCGGTCAEDKKLCAGKCIPNDMVCEGSCPTGSHDCSGLCPLDTEVNSCGTSCVPCPVPQGAMKATCEAGQCDFICEAGYHRCGDTCKKDDDASACGASCTACPASPDGTAVCSGGTCSLACKTGFHLCGDKCVSNTAPESCGMSCTACNVPNGGQATCDGTSCGTSCPTGMKVCKGNCIAMSAACDGSCPSGSHDCSGFCVANNHVNSCGPVSCSTCPVPNGASQATCDGVSCSFDCSAGFHKCGDNTCRKDDDVNACGTSCTPCPTDPNGTAVCTTGQCKIACKTGFHLCGNVCVTNNSVDHCGDSCSACQTAPTGGSAGCDGTRCLSVCPAGKPQLCAGACIDASASCSGKCPAGKHDCSGTCVPDDSTNSCGTRCGACPLPQGGLSTECKAGGTCDFSCASGYHKCGSSCPSDSDPMACGAGCMMCAGDPNGVAICSSGTCDVICSGGYHKCGGKCVSNSALATCGQSCSACGAAPAGGTMTCDGSQCQPMCPGGQYLCNGTCISINQACNGNCSVAGTRSCNGSCKANDTSACGPNCVTCTGPTTGTGSPTCNGTSCVVSCSGSTTRLCGTSVCISSGSSACCSSGDCTQAPSANRTPTCNNYACSYPCAANFRECGGACVPNGQCCAALGEDCTAPTIVSTTPANASTKVAVNAPIVIVFSEAMNTNTVQSAFSTSPATSGSFTWNGPGTQVTYQPSAPLSNGGRVTFNISTAAKDLAGNSMAAARSFYFDTRALITKTLTPSGTNASYVPFGVCSSSYYRAGVQLYRQCPQCPYNRYSESFFVTFDLTEVPQGAIITSGNFRVTQQSCGSSLYRGGMTLSARISDYAIDVCTPISLSPYTADAVVSTNATLGVKTLLVTGWANDALADRVNRNNQMVFHLQVSDPTMINGDDFCYFYDSLSANRPTLELRYEEL